MPEEQTKKLRLEIAHVLFIDIVGYSKLSIDEQRFAIERLNQAVQATESFREAEAAGRLAKIPTGDGMALVFYDSPESPVECAMEISRNLFATDAPRVRMGIHSGPVSGVVDVSGRANIAGEGINIAQRVMDCGDAGHILLSNRVAQDLSQFKHWRPQLHDLGECEVKHGTRLGVVNFFTSEIGNSDRPTKLEAAPAAATASAAKRARMRWYVAGMALLVIVSALILFRMGATSRRPVRSEAEERPGAMSLPIAQKSIAVLPFDNLSENKENAYFADGVQDEILTDLSKLAELKVISRSSVMHYKSGVERNLRKIGEELGVAHVVEGSVQRSANRIRVNAQLIDTRNDSHLWAQTYDRDLADVFAIQSEIAKAIADQLQAKLSAGEKAAIEQKPTSDLTAYDYYVRAKVLADLGGSPAFGAKVRSNLLEAAGLLEQAITRDPNFFQAYCQLAVVNDRLYFFGSDHTPERLALAEQAVAAATRLRPDSGETHLTRAVHAYMGYRDYDRARSELAIAGRALPNEAQVPAILGFMDRRQSRWEDHIRNLNRALELDPRNLFLLQEFSVSYLALHRFGEMAAILDRALTLSPDDPVVRVARATVDLYARADTRPLHAAVQEIVARNPSAATSIALPWSILAMCERDWPAAAQAVANIPVDGLSTENTWFPRRWFEAVLARARGDSAAAEAAFKSARVEVEKVVREQPDYGEPLCVLAMIDAGLGRKNEAMQEGQHAVELLPETKDALNGVNARRYLAVTYTWLGEKDRALAELSAVTKAANYLNYGRLKLHPEWDPLRGDPRFEQIVSSLAPK